MKKTLKLNKQRVSSNNNSGNNKSKDIFKNLKSHQSNRQDVWRDVRQLDVLDDRQDDDERFEALLHLGGQLLQRQVLADLPGAGSDERPHEEMHDKPTGKIFYSSIPET